MAHTQIQITLKMELLLDILPKVISDENYDDEEVKLLIIILSFNKDIGQKAKAEIFDNWLARKRLSLTLKIMRQIQVGEKIKPSAEAALSLVDKMVANTKCSDEEVRLCFLLLLILKDVSCEERNRVFNHVLVVRPKLAESLTADLTPAAKPESSFSATGHGNMQRGSYFRPPSTRYNIAQ